MKKFNKKGSKIKYCCRCKIPLNKENSYACFTKTRTYICRKCYKKKQNKYKKIRYRIDRIGDMDRIEKLCLEHGFSVDVAKAIAMDGVILDEKMKEKGLVK